MNGNQVKRGEPMGREIDRLSIHQLLARLCVMCGRDSGRLLKNRKCVKGSLHIYSDPVLKAIK